MESDYDMQKKKFLKLRNDSDMLSEEKKKKKDIMKIDVYHTDVLKRCLRKYTQCTTLEIYGFTGKLKGFEMRIRVTKNTDAKQAIEKCFSEEYDMEHFSLHVQEKLVKSFAIFKKIVQDVGGDFNGRKSQT
eukprot:UN09612